MSRKRRRGRPPSGHGPGPEPPPAPPPARTRLWPLGLFAAAFATRVLFWRATRDAAWPGSAYFKGDAWLWLDYARALTDGQPFELGLPIHPPGTAYLLALLWDGRASALAWLKLTGCAMGALTVVLASLAMERTFGRTVGRLAGVLMAASTGLLMLSTSLNSEAPYLLLVAASFWLLPDPTKIPGPVRLAVWAAVNGLACLFRVEHALFFALVLAFLAALWRRTAWRRLVAAVALACAAFLLPLVPWHVKAWRAIARINATPPAPPEGVRRLAERLAWMTWDDEARARREALPAFARYEAVTFVAATMAHRGGSRVRAEDFGILAEAFGHEPRPLPATPFVSLYGPLNFALANHPHATAGFSRAALEEPPLLGGGPEAYPPELIQGLPPPELALSYPPHLALFNHGYALGWRWIRVSPARALRLAGEKLRRFWAGAALGLTGLGLPLGLEGVRYAVDIAVPVEGWVPRAWRLALLIGCALGVAAAWRDAALYPWLLYLVSRTLTAALFFGYARFGASAIPAVALLVALASERRLGRCLAHALRRWGRRLALGALLLVVAVEAARCWQRPALALDGRLVGSRDPIPAEDHVDHRLTLAR